MNLVNERVEHISFGEGVIIEVDDNKICVRFEENIGTKIFIYPDAFEKFLKAADKTVENKVMEEFHKKQEQIEQELERIEKEREAAKLEEKAKLELTKKKPTRAKKK
ncbi:MAG: hypothetical protein K0R09_745 [Clostridiales bacterium]|jgi:ATPase subunit of ABC transporter with duplicated ATPase domains|nr:hypothetical protein [Clostridiales bacterium]